MIVFHFYLSDIDEDLICLVDKHIFLVGFDELLGRVCWYSVRNLKFNVFYNFESLELI